LAAGGCRPLPRARQAASRISGTPNLEKAIHAANLAWHLHERVWYDKHPGRNPRNSPEYKNYVEDLFSRCTELSLLRDVAETGKHRGLGRATLKLQADTGSGSPGGIIYETSPFGMTQSTPKGTLQIELADGSTHDFADTLKAAVDFWKAELS
jgi:hypothetical protein